MGLGATLEPWLTADVNAAANTTTASASVEVKLGVPLTVRGSLRFKAKLPVIGEFGWEKSYDFGRYDIIRERSIYSRSWTWSIAGSAPSPVNAVAPKPPTAPVVIPSGGTTYPIARTSGQGILLFNSPRVTDIKTSGPNDGARVTISCQVWGEPAGPYSNHVWDYIRWNGKEGFIPDTYVDSPTVADQFLVGAQRCADPGVVVQAPASAPVAQVFAATNSPSGATFVSSSPSLAATRRTGPSLGDHFVIICQAWGDPYGNFNNHVWDKITWAGSDGYLPDTYASTPVVADQFVSGIARCAGGDPPVVVTNPTVATHAEQQGHNGANTFSNTHTISGAGPRVSPGQIVNVSCKVLDTSAASISPDGYWYRLADSPWNNQYYAAANTFYNGDPINGPYTHNTDFSVPDCNPVVQPPPTPNPTLYPEQQGSRGANTFLDHHAISGQGVSVAPRQTVNVSCKVLDTSAASISPDGYWYRLADSPWNNQYYAAANTFYNGDPINGPYTHNTDFNVPNC